MVSVLEAVIVYTLYINWSMKLSVEIRGVSVRILYLLEKQLLSEGCCVRRPH